MPKIPVDEAPAGPAMDAAVAGALGWHYGWGGWWEDEEGQIQKPACIGCDGKSTWSPSEDIAAAWELIEWCRANLDLLTTFIEWKECWDVTLSDGSNLYGAVAETVPLAICRAFLKANGVEFMEMPK